ncbi:hypothetical protein KOR42_09930 [Thalassoglobus neptunius]|uniref:Uncharacterized protein n=1 Tax=Thalassoglobus neptunius TaxID=1938619 RepID=A0A5C5X5M9_9PLAN|nr:hypothetical protein [Thalassoglobus neptunius]TWT57631.1 hypothetical protein KOR42_09930 [Thalassoglobus neptunius]
MDKRRRSRTKQQTEKKSSTEDDKLFEQLNQDIEGLERLQVMQLQLIREIRNQLQHVSLRH